MHCRSVICLFAAIALALALAGCSSKKSSVKGSSGYPQASGSGTPSTMRPDYSNEVADGMGEDLVAEARRWLGTPYAYGGNDRGGTDCSGLVMEVYRKVCMVKIPRTTVTQKSYCTEVARNKACIGDLMFFGRSTGGSEVTHVGLYIGAGKMIHASSSRGVMVSNVDEGYWGKRFRGAGRVDGAKKSWAQHNGKRHKNKSDDNQPPNSRDVASVSATTPSAVVPATAVASTSSATEANASTPVATTSIDLLDLIINQKVDSIFSTRFMD